MKLHLPKSLLVAVLAVVATVPTAMAISITGTGELKSYTMDATKQYTGVNVVYNINDGLGRISGLNTDVYTITFDINREALKSTANNDKPLMYVDTGSYQWGFQVFDCTHKNGNQPADGVLDITGHWSGSTDKKYKADEIFSQVADLTTDTVTAVITQSKNAGGTRLYAGTDTTVSTPYYSNADLFTSSGGNFKSAVFNTSLVKTIHVQEYEQFTATAGDWTKTFNLSDTAVISGTTKVEAGVGHSALSKGNIVISGTNQLFLQSWKNGGNPNELNVSSNIYMGATSYTESDSGAAFNNVALRFGNDETSKGGNVTNVTGNIYVVEDAMMKSGSTNAINISGTVTDTVDGVDTDSTLTISGEGYNFTGTVDLSGLVLNSGAKVTFDSDSATFAALTTGGLLTNDGSLSVSDTLYLQNAITNNGALDLSGTTIAINQSTAGVTLEKAAIDVAGNGLVKTVSVFTNNGEASAKTDIGGVTLYGLALGAGKYALSSDGTLSVTEKVYRVNNDTIYSKISSVAADENLIVHVASGKTYDVKGGEAYNKVVLESGATLANTGNAVGTKENGCNLKQNYYIELLGDANIKADKDFAMVKGSHQNATLKLNGYTLTKLGSGIFTFNSVIADAGTIAINAGGVVLNEQNDTYKSDFDEVDFTMSSGTTLRNIDSMTIKSLTSKGGSITVDSGKLLTVNGAFALNGGTSQLSGSLKAANLTVSNGGKLTMATGSVLDLTGKFAELSVKNGGNNTRFNDLITLVNSTTTNGTAYVLVNGISTTNENADDKQSVVGNINMQNNVTLSSNLTFTNNLNLNGKGWDKVNNVAGAHEGYQFTVDNGATLKIGTTGTGQLALITQADLIIEDASVTAGLIKLGHTSGNSSDPYEGTISLTHADSKLTAEKIQFQGANADNALSMTAGKLEFTGDGAVFTGNDNNAVGSVSISGGEVVVNKDQSMNTVASKRSVSLSNMSFNIAENKSMALDTGVTVSGDVTVKGKGTLKFAGGNNLSALSGTVKVTEAAKLQYMSDAVSVAAKGATGAAVSASAIQDAVVTVGGTADVSISQILSDSSLAYNGTSNLGIAGDGHTLTGVAAGNGSISFSGNAGIVNSEGSALASMSNVTISKLDIATAADKTIQVSGNSSTAAGQMSGLLALEEGASLKLSNVTMSESSSVQGYGVAAPVVMAADGTGNTAITRNSVTLENTTVKLGAGATVPAVVQATAGNVIAQSVADEIGVQASAKVYTFTSDIFNGVTLNATGANALNVELSSVLTDALYGKGYDYVALSFENSTIVSGSENGINVTFEDEALTHLAPSVFLADNTIYIAIDQIPEPATATLSLLALAALAARRRRRK